MLKQQGLTIIEVVVMVGILSSIMVTLTAILFNSFQVSTKINFISKVEENGSLVLGEIRRQVMRADPSTLVCGGASLVFTDKTNKAETVTIECVDGGEVTVVSSVDGGLDLVSNEIRASNCDDFVDCENLGSQSPTVVINFVLSAGSSEPGNKSFYSRNFGSRLTVRN